MPNTPTSTTTHRSLGMHVVRDATGPAHIAHDRTMDRALMRALDPAFCVPLYWSFLASVGSQVGSHSRWTTADGYGRQRTANRFVPDATDDCGPLWTGCVHLRIRRLGIRVPPGVPLSPVPKGLRRVTTDGPSDVGSHSGSHSLRCDPNRAARRVQSLLIDGHPKPLRKCRSARFGDVGDIAHSG